MNAPLHSPGQDQLSHAGTDFGQGTGYDLAQSGPTSNRVLLLWLLDFFLLLLFLVNITFSFSNPFQIPKMIQFFLEVAVLASFSGNVDFEYLKVRSPNLSLDIWKSDQGLANSVSNRDLKLFSQKIISEICLRISATREKRWEIIF